MSPALRMASIEESTRAALEGISLFNRHGAMPNATQIAAIRRILCSVTARLEVMESEAALAEERERNK